MAATAAPITPTDSGARSVAAQVDPAVHTAVWPTPTDKATTEARAADDPSAPANVPFAPIADATGMTPTGGGNAGGPVAGISRPISGVAPDLLSTVRVRPGTGPPDWWFYDAHNHPS